MKEYKIDTHERKKQGKEISSTIYYIFLKSGKGKKQRVEAGIGILLHEQFEQNVKNVHTKRAAILLGGAAGDTRQITQKSNIKHL